MPSKHKRTARPLRIRGNNICVVIPKDIARRLGWNHEDVVSYDVIEGHLVITKCKLPTVPDLRLQPVDDYGRVTLCSGCGNVHLPNECPADRFNE